MERHDRQQLHRWLRPREEQETPILYEMQSEGGDSWIYDDQYKVGAVSFSMAQESETEENFNSFIEDKWYYDLHARRYVVENPQQNQNFSMRER